MELQYQLIKSNRKTVVMSVERDKTVIVRAPENITQKEINEFIQKKKYWLYAKLNHPQKYRKTCKTEFISGASVLYLGKYYKLDVKKEKFDGILFSNRFIISKKNQKNANKLFKEWYIQKAQEKIIPKTRVYAKNLGVQFKSVQISEFKYRWGSCTPKNNIKFNWRLIKAPPHVIDYIIIHELGHLIEPNHTPRFWNIIKTQVPKFLEAKEWLKNNGYILEVDF
ncbi:MAG: SprT family zinc-dependent metalloprotease [Candidatus Aenigmatarchaeota archaeon]